MGCRRSGGDSSWVCKVEVQPVGRFGEGLRHGSGLHCAIYSQKEGFQYYSMRYSHGKGGLLEGFDILGAFPAPHQ